MDSRETALDVWSPLGGSRRVRVVASNCDYIGLYVAEGSMHPSMYWPELARLYADQLRQAECDCRQLRRDSEARQRREYAANWVSRWLADTGAGEVAGAEEKG